MTYTLPMTIRRSYLGLFLIFFAGAVVLVFLIYVGYKLNTQQHADPIAAQLAMFMAVVVMLVTLVSMYVYWGAKLVMTDSGLQVLRYTTLFWSTQSTVSWADIQEVSITEAGLLKSLTGVGGILVQPASAIPTLSLSWVGNVDSLRDFIAAKAEAADNPSQNP